MILCIHLQKNRLNGIIQQVKTTQTISYKEKMVRKIGKLKFGLLFVFMAALLISTASCIPGSGGAGDDMSSIYLIVFMVLIIGFLYYTSNRSQKKQQKKQQEMMSQLRKVTKY